MTAPAFDLTGLEPQERAAVLRWAHAQAKAYRILGSRPPQTVAGLEREYQRWRKRVQRHQEPG